MAKLQMTSALLCVLIASQYAQAVINKSADAPEAEKKNEVGADDRISNVYGAPAEDYGLPLDVGFKGPAATYGPPELVGDHRPAAGFPLPAPELPTSIFGSPSSSYGPPRNFKSHYGPPKQTYGLPPVSFPPKSTYGPPKLHYGPPKQHYAAPPSFASFRPPKPQYGPPLKLSGPSFAPPSDNYGPPKSGHGPPIPLSIETYGPPAKALPLSFHTEVKDEYGPPPPPPAAPQIQYGPPSNQYGPPVVAPPGVPAPPTPPDIKYDGWQPIAGAPNHQAPPSDNYGPPSGGSFGQDSHVSSQSHATVGTLNINSNVPSDSYGVPIHNPEDQNLKSSVHESVKSAEHSGLPPPPLPQFEPLHNENNVPKSAPTSGFQQQPGLDYGTPNVQPLSIVKTVGFELLPTPGALTADVNSVGHSGFEHTSSFDSSSHSFSHGGSDVLVQSPPQKPHADFGLAIEENSFAKVNSAAGLSVPTPILDNTYGVPPPSKTYGTPADTYGAPPSSSFSSSGPYPLPLSGHGSSFSSVFGSGFSSQKHAHHHKSHGSFRHGVPNALIPPRNREPIKFKESIPFGLLNNLHRYLPPSRPAKTYGLPLGPQLPSLKAPLSFHHATGGSFSSSFSTGDSFAKTNSHAVSPIAAPHATYGTPLSFTGFNTPAPVLTYGAPNFGPATSFVSTTTGFGSNLYNSVTHGLPATYGTPVVNAPLSTGFKHDCNNAQNTVGSLSESTSFSSSGNHQSSLFNAPALPAVPNTAYNAPNVNELDLQHHEQPKTNLKDSYGNPIGVQLETGPSAQALDHVHSSSSGVSQVVPLAASSQPENNFVNAEGLSAEALTASLTAQGYGQAKSLASNEVEGSQYLKTEEGSQALALAQGLTAEGSDGFQIQGSKGTYTLQIQSADGGLNTENSDGSIRHDQVLSNGLLQDILAAIEQPESGRIQLQSGPIQSMEEFYRDLSNAASNSPSQFIMIDEGQKKGLEEIIGQASEKSSVSQPSSNDEQIALFFNNQNEDSNKETRSVSKDEAQPTTSAPKETEENDSKSKSS